VTELRKALELDPRLHRARATLAFALVGAARPPRRWRRPKKAWEADDKLGEAYAPRALPSLRRTRTSGGEAIGQAQQGKFLNPQNCVVILTVGRLFETQNLDQATAAYSECVKVDPKSVAGSAR
jgi:cytochrome c-type biogenesis protein CcmH/NrfG